jgi:hypothetical protein
MGVLIPCGIFALVSPTPAYAPPNPYATPEASHDRRSEEAS